MSDLSDVFRPLIDAVVATRRAVRPDLLGVVTGTSPFTVRIGGEPVDVHLPRLGSYTPTLSDLVVIVERGKGDLIVTGKAVA